MEQIKNYKRNLLFFIFLSFSVYFIILIKNNHLNFIVEMKAIPPLYFGLILGFVMLYLMIETLTLHLFTIHKIRGVSLFELFKLNLATKFFNAITPFSAGGQPFQLIYFSRRGIRAKDSASIVLMNYNLYAISFGLVGLLFLSFKYPYFNTLLEGNGYIFIIGFFIHIFFTSIIYLLVLSKKIYHVTIDLILPKLGRIRWLRKFNMAEKQIRLKHYISELNEEIKFLNKNKSLWLYSVTLNLLRIFILYSIPVLVFMSLGSDVNGQILNLIIGGYLIGLVISYIPLPGGSGGAEGFFYLIYGSLIKQQSDVITALVLWRFFTFYLVILLGFISVYRLNYDVDLKKVNYLSD